MIHRLKTLLSRERPHVVVECRDCGTSVDIDNETCPACGSAEIVRYEIQ